VKKAGSTNFFNYFLRCYISLPKATRKAG